MSRVSSSAALSFSAVDGRQQVEGADRVDAPLALRGQRLDRALDDREQTGHLFGAGGW